MLIYINRAQQIVGMVTSMHAMCMQRACKEFSTCMKLHACKSVKTPLSSAERI